MARAVLVLLAPNRRNPMKRLDPSFRRALLVACILSIAPAAHAQEEAAPEGLNVTELQIGRASCRERVLDHV